MKAIVLFFLFLACLFIGVSGAIILFASSITTTSDGSAKTPTQDQAQMPSITQVHTLCNELKDLAVSVMTYRQNNVPFEALIEAITNSPNQKAKVYAIAITTQAYKIPMPQSNDGKKSQTQKFASYVYNQCAQNPELLLRQG